MERTLFWFRNYPISMLEGKSPLMLLADDCLDIVLQELNRTFRVHNESLGKFWEKVREDTIFLQEDLVRRVPMYTAYQVARICTPARTLDSEFLVARDLAKAGTMFHVMYHRKPLFPKYQFGVNGPKPIIEKIIQLLSPHRSTWDIALWFSAGSGWLGDRRPQDLLETDPALVTKAAEQDALQFYDS